MGKHPHEPDINMLLRQCDVHNIPLATNLATAQFLTGNQPFKRG
jgi:methylglyoxal synthase